MNKIIGIYKITNIVNNKIYLGSSFNIRKRLYEHKRLLRLGKHVNFRLQESWNEFGETKFKFEIVEIISNNSISNKDLRDLETSYIQKYKSYSETLGFNIIPGGLGTLNLPCSKEKRKKISKSNLGKQAWNKGLPMSKEQVEKLRTERISKYGKPINIYDRLGKYIETLNSISEVVDKYKVSKNSVISCCKNKSVPKNYIFTYHNINNKPKNIIKYEIFDLNNNLLKECIYKREVIKFITNSEKRNGSLERKLNDCIKGITLKLYNKYLIKSINALNSSNIIDEPRQPNNG